MESNTHINEESARKFEVFYRIEKEEYKAVNWYTKILGYRSTIKTTEWIIENLKMMHVLFKPTTNLISPNGFIHIFMVSYYGMRNNQIR